VGSAADQKSTKWIVVELPPIVDGSQLRTPTQRLTVRENYEIQFALNTDLEGKVWSVDGANINEYLAGGG